MNSSTDAALRTIEECYLEAARHSLSSGNVLAVSFGVCADSPVMYRSQEYAETAVLSADNTGDAHIHFRLHTDCDGIRCVVSFPLDCPKYTFEEICRLNKHLFPRGIPSVDDEDRLVECISGGQCASRYENIAYIAAPDCPSALEIALAVDYIARLGRFSAGFEW